MIILGIETSCDETAAAIIEGANKEGGVKILSNITATSAGLHAKTGGVIPEQAARKQLQVVIPVIEMAIKEAHISQEKIDAIAVTFGPGLIGSLLVGVETAKTLSFIWDKPIIPVNHLVGHIYANWIDSNQWSVNSEQRGLKSNLHQTPNTKHRTPTFPALALVVSGGHTDLVIMKGHNNLEWIGGTRDDAAGEAFDKTARLLGIPYPGGPELAKVADDFIEKNPDKKLDLFPRPLINSNKTEWSFSGLKTSVLRKISELQREEGGKKLKKLSEYKKVSGELLDKHKDRLAAEVQEAIVDVLVDKTLKAAKKYKPKSLLISGGVSANRGLREKFAQSLEKSENPPKLFIPPINLCTDNASYIAACAFYNHSPTPWQKVDANPELTIMGNKNS